MVDSRRASILLASFLGPLAGNMVLALVPVLKQDFQSTAPEVLLSVTFFMLPFALFMLFSGAISDLYDRRRMMLLGLSVYSFGCFMCAISPELSFFLVSRSIQGFGYAFVMPLLVAIMGDIVPTATRGRWMGLMGAATTAGMAMGPFVAGMIAEINWRYAFVLVGFLAVLVALYFLHSFRGFEFPHGRLTMRVLIIGMGRCMRNGNVVKLALAGFLTFLCYVSCLSFVSDHLSLPPLSLRESEIGVLMTATGLAGIVSSPIGGRLVDRIGRRSTAVIGYCTLALAFVVLALSESRGEFFGSLACMGAGIAIVWSALLTLTVEVDPSSKGTVSSLFNSSRYFGYALAPVLFAPLYVTTGLVSIEMCAILIAILAIAVVWGIAEKR